MEERSYRGLVEPCGDKIHQNKMSINPCGRGDWTVIVQESLKDKIPR